MQSFSIFGKQINDMIPVIAKSKLSENDLTILDIGFETNPLDKVC